MSNYFSTISKFSLSPCGFIALLLCIYACSAPVKKEEKHEEEKTATKPTIVKKPPSSFNDTLVIAERAAVFFNADSSQMEKVKAINKQNVFATIKHDCYYQMRYSKTMLQQYWPNIKIIEAFKARYLLFVRADESKLCIDLNNKNDICGLFLFDRKNDPVLADMPNINTVLGFYFKK